MEWRRIAILISSSTLTTVELISSRSANASQFTNGWCVSPFLAQPEFVS